ncbi:hypothetical protein [Nocardioides sp. GXQ0305]|uniref:hypothetical protein n=1 Tax=Nocardioides sp. GXQ0305 TaxID=3423912 RepID=UPI003D7C942A
MSALVVVLIVVLVGGVALAAALRSVSLEQVRREQQLHDPRSHTVSYAVPPGVDPATVLAAVRASGFTGVVDPTGPTEHVLVGCGESDRPRLRSVIEAIGITGYDGAAVRGPVVFEDER